MTKAKNSRGGVLVKKVKKPSNPLAKAAEAEFKAELVPIFAACMALSDKYEKLAKDAWKNKKLYERLHAKAVKMDESIVERQLLSDRHMAFNRLWETYSDLAACLNSSLRKSWVPDLEGVVVINASDFSGLDDLAELDRLRYVGTQTKPTGGAALSAATKTVRKGKST